MTRVGLEVLERRDRGTTSIPPPVDLRDKFKNAKQAQKLDWGEELLQSQRRLRYNPMKKGNTNTFERGCKNSNAIVLHWLVGGASGKKSCKQIAIQPYCISSLAVRASQKE
jgi:hypothetical protein